MTHFRPMLGAALGALLLLASPAAAAKPQPPATATCAAPGPTSQVFLPQFADPGFYYLAPDGSFEKKAWSGGTVVAGNESYFVRSTKDARSMALTGAVVSPEMCISLDAPTIRFFARRISGSGLLGVTAVGTSGGVPLRLPLAPASSDGEWRVTAPTPIVFNLAAPLDVMGVLNGSPASRVRFELTPAPGSTWQVDDFHVDPYGRR